MGSGLGDRNDRFGGLGRNGAQKTAHAHDGDLLAVGEPYDFTTGHVQNSLADEFIASHGDVANDQTDPNQLSEATQAGTDVKMASQVLRRLEAKSLIRREVDPADTRARRLRVTDRGAALAREAVAAVEAADAAFFRSVPDVAGLLAVLPPLAGRGEER